MNFLMKASTRKLATIHGWRIDRFVHNYLYFAFYHPYIRTAMAVVKLTRSLAWFKPLRIVGRMAFDRYHNKVLSAGQGFCCDWLQFVGGVIPGINTTTANPMCVWALEHYESDGQ